MRKNAIRYFASLSSGTVASLTGEKAYSAIDRIIAHAIDWLSEAPESVIMGLMLDDEHVDWSQVKGVLVRARNAICGGL